MSMGLRIGHAKYIGTKKPKAWQLNLFAIFVFLPIALVFAACGWCLIFARFVTAPLTRPDRNTNPGALGASTPAQRPPE